MHRHVAFVFVFAVLTGCFATRPEAGRRGPGPDAVVAASGATGRDPQLEVYLRSIPHHPQIQPVAPHVVAPGAPMDMGLVNRRRRICRADRFSQTNAFQEIVALDPNTASVYPGALVEGRTLSSGRFTEIALPRAPIALTVTGMPVARPDVVLSATVERPTLGNVQGALNRIVGDPSALAPNRLARMALQIAYVRSFEQGLLDAGVSASWLSGDFSSRLKSVTSSRKTSLIVHFTQTYYEASANGLVNASDAFARGVTLDQLQRVAYSADAASSRPLNPPLYVKTVKYGRMAILAVASDAEEKELVAAVRAGFGSIAGGGSLKLDAASKQILEKSTIDGVVIGGSGKAGAALLSAIGSADLSGLRTFLESGASYDPLRSPGAPIAYVMTYLDNVVADSAFSADFSSTGCTDEAVAIDKLRIGWNVGDDDKDQEMYPYVIVRDRDGRIVGDSGNEGRLWASAVVPMFGNIRVNAVWKDHLPYGPFEVPVAHWTLDRCDSAMAEVGQRSSNGEDPEWHTTFFIDVLVNGQWYTVRGPAADTNEFKWGDGKPDSASVPLVCPPL